MLLLAVIGPYLMACAVTGVTGSVTTAVPAELIFWCDKGKES
jgi:hypothetical protein